MHGMHATQTKTEYWPKRNKSWSNRKCGKFNMQRGFILFSFLNENQPLSSLYNIRQSLFEILHVVPAVFRLSVDLHCPSKAVCNKWSKTLMLLWPRDARPILFFACAVGGLTHSSFASNTATLTYFCLWPILLGYGISFRFKYSSFKRQSLTSASLTTNALLFDFEPYQIMTLCWICTHTLRFCVLSSVIHVNLMNKRGISTTEMQL